MAFCFRMKLPHTVEGVDERQVGMTSVLTNVALCGNT